MAAEDAALDFWRSALADTASVVLPSDFPRNETLQFVLAEQARALAVAPAASSDDAMQLCLTSIALLVNKVRLRSRADLLPRPSPARGADWSCARQGADAADGLQRSG